MYCCSVPTTVVSFSFSKLLMNYLNAVLSLYITIASTLPFPLMSLKSQISLTFCDEWMKFIHSSKQLCTFYFHVKQILLYKHINGSLNYKTISAKTSKNKAVTFTLRQNLVKHWWSKTAGDFVFRTLVLVASRFQVCLLYIGFISHIRYQ